MKTRKVSYNVFFLSPVNQISFAEKFIRCLFDLYKYDIRTLSFLGKTL